MKQNRLLFISDTHYTTDVTPRDKEGFLYYYGETPEYRMQKLFSLILEEHHKSPVDAVVFLGDTSHEKEEYLRDFCENWSSGLPCPSYFLPGNHEKHDDQVWEELTGSPRQSVVHLPYCHILLCDNFSDLTHPHRLQPIDMEFLTREAKRCSGEPILVCTHYFRQEEALEQWLLSTPEVVAVFHGHSHFSYPTMESIGGKKVISTGNFSYGLKMKDADDWHRISGWSITDVIENNGQWKCRKIYPEMEYDFSKLPPENRFCGELSGNYSVKKEYGEWMLLSDE